MTPFALRELHRAHSVGDVIDPPDGALDDLFLAGAGFRIRSDGRLLKVDTLADSVGTDMTLLLVGLNPSPAAAATGIGFAGPGNRFWPAAVAAGIISVPRDPDHALAHHGVGMSDLVKRVTTRAAEVSRSEFGVGATRVESMVERLRPHVVCMVGLSGWRAARDRRAVAGWQTARFGGRPLYVMPNPSGLNAGVSLGELSDHFATAAAGPAGAPTGERTPRANAPGGELA